MTDKNYYVLAMTTGYGKRIVFEDEQQTLDWFAPQEVIEDLEPLLDLAVSDHCSQLELCHANGDPVKHAKAQEIIGGLAAGFNELATNWFGAMRRLDTWKYEPYVKGVQDFIQQLKKALELCEADSPRKSIERAEKLLKRAHPNDYEDLLEIILALDCDYMLDRDLAVQSVGFQDGDDKLKVGKLLDIGGRVMVKQVIDYRKRLADARKGNGK